MNAVRPAKALLVVGGALASLLLLAACSPERTAPGSTEVASVELAVDVASDTISSLGGQLRVRVIARTRDGRVAERVTLLWGVSDASVLFLVSSDSAGARVAGLQNGVAELRVQAKSMDQPTWITSAKSIVVRQKGAGLVIVQQGYDMHSNIPGLIGISADAVTQVEARPVDGLGSYVSGGIPAVFSVDDSTIVRTSPSGQVIAIRDGTTTLHARALFDGHTKTGSVRVGLRGPAGG